MTSEQIDKRVTDNMSAYNSYLYAQKKYPDVVIIVRMPEEYALFDESSDKTGKLVPNPTFQATEGAARSTRFPRKDLDIVLSKMIRAGYRVAIADYK